MMKGVMMMMNKQQQQQQNQQQQNQQQQTVVMNMDENMSNLTSAASGEASVSSSTLYHHQQQQYFSQPQNQPQNHQAPAAPPKKKRNLPGNPDPDAEVIALSPKSLLATNRFLCEICNKGFQRDQNLQLHRRGHNLPWKLKQRSNKEVRKKVYVCPEPSCVHHDPSRALGDLTGIKKHFCRKHGEKKWKCDKCSKKYAVQSDWKAHSKTCGTREYRCDCGTLFSRRDSFITHRAFCDALAEETARSITVNHPLHLPTQASAVAGTSSAHHLMNLHHQQQQQQQQHSHLNIPSLHPFQLKREQMSFNQTNNFNMMMRSDLPPWLSCPLPPPQQQPNPSQLDLSTTTNTVVLPPPPVFDPRTQQQMGNCQEYHDHSNPNPSMGTSLPSPYPLSSHMSATALLQKAAQMGATMSTTTSTTTTMPLHHHGNHGHVPITKCDMATSETAAAGNHNSNDNSTHNDTAVFGINLASREEMASGFMTHFGNKADATSAPIITDHDVVIAGGAANGGVRGGTHPLSSSSSSSLLHDMMNSLSSGTGFQNAYDDDAFGAMMDNKDASFFHQTAAKFGTGSAKGRGGGNDDLTRDFLGLRPLSHNEIMNMAAAGIGAAGLGGNGTVHGIEHDGGHEQWRG
ncbi:hypothetical protein Droror1_Dr00006324 [Drosera rotundifolia]